MRTGSPALPRFVLLCTVGLLLVAGGATPLRAADARELNVLFIGNSYTARHRLAQIVKAMAEERDPGLSFSVTTVIYGGRRLVDHWRLGTANYVRLASLTVEEEKQTVASLERMVAENPEDKHAKGALRRHRPLLGTLGAPRKKWDIVVLQSYRDDLKGDTSLYAAYAPRFAELIKAQGGRVILYETTPKTQNARPLTAPPDPGPVLAKATSIARLAKRVGAAVAPMSLIGLRCQTERPDLPLRFVNDAHLNHTMAYLTACALYAAMFDRSPQGLSVDTVTDIRFLDKDNRDKDRDGKPITRTFSAEDRADLQRIAWQSCRQFKKIRADLAQP